jgi:hypothetical protein
MAAAKTLRTRNLQTAEAMRFLAKSAFRPDSHPPADVGLASVRRTMQFFKTVRRWPSFPDLGRTILRGVGL